MFQEQTLQRLYTYVNSIVARHGELYVKESPTPTEIALGALCALQEEVGELSAEVRRHTRMTFSAKKADMADMDNILSEACDVLLCTLILMRELGGDRDFSEILERKISANNARGY